jgi:hypothetical protein
MKNNVTLSLLVKNYQITRNEDLFNEIYIRVSKKLSNLIRMFSNRFYLDRADVESVAHFKLYEIVMTHDNTKGDFTKNLSKAIQYGCIDLVKKKKYIEAHESLVSAKTDDEGNETDPLEHLASANAEDEIIERIQKNCDQRQLIANLLKDADENTRQCLAAYAKSFSYLDAAKQLGGISDKTVKKRIRKLSLKYDANRMGDIRDYFTAPTVSVG